MAEAAAIPEPDSEPNIALPAMLVSASEPGTRPSTSMARLTRRCARPPLPIRLPARMKNGTASRLKLSMPVVSFWAAMNIANLGDRNMVMVTAAEVMMLKETGVPMISRKAKTMTRTMAAEISIYSSASFRLFCSSVKCSDRRGMLYSTIITPHTGTPA